MPQKDYTAAAVIIGNEVLSGRVTDANVPFLANELKALGIRLREARIIPDIEEEIVEAVNTLRARHDYVFTTGGIGPTHDDITAASIAVAVGRPLIRHPAATRILEEHYGDQLNDARLRMANTPEGAVLLENPISRAPGFQVENIFVLPGVPSILQAIFHGFKHRLAGGKPLKARTITMALAESAISEGFQRIQMLFPDMEMGSYPYIRGGRFGASIVLRSADEAALEAAAAEVIALARSLGAEPRVHERESGDISDF